MNRKAIVLVLSSMAALQGCAGFGVGESEYSCDGYGEGISCASAREVYRQTTSGSDPDEGNEDTKESEKDNGEQARQDRRRAATQRRSGGIEPQAESEKQRQPESSRQVGQHVAIDGPTPIRTQAKVMRAWIASYEDQKGDLHVPGLVYTEVEERRWNIGNEAPSGKNRQVQPLTQSQAKGEGVEATSQPSPTEPDSQQQEQQQQQQEQQQQAREAMPSPTQR